MHASGGELGRVDHVKHTIPMDGSQLEEVPRAMLWLVGPKASSATGTFLDISGGN